MTTPTKTLTEWLVTGEGLASDQTALVHFGLGKESRILNLKVLLSNDQEISIDNPKVNSMINLRSEIDKEVKISRENVREN
nr:ASPIC/UnbV domain-containing protein [Nonlabens ulvanivorans]